ncbi:MAG: RDD family protein [Campylobacterota bacterium]|nr:RDD family protein [Campylobacterota bacterium]
MNDIDNLELASLRSRMKAFIIDDLSITFIVGLLLWDTIASSSGDMESIIIILNSAFLQIVILKFLYQTIFIWYYGATIGKYFAKIRVIDYNYFGRVSLSSALLRSMGRILSESFFYIGFLLAYYTESKQTFQDKIAKTLVVNA